MAPVGFSIKIAVIGGGAWGTALAGLLAKKGHAVSLWVYEEEVARAILRLRQNTLYLPGVLLPETLTVSSDIPSVLAGSRCVLFAVPAQHARMVLKRMAPFLPPNIPVVSATKGIEIKTRMRMSEVIRETLQRSTLDRIAVLSGPSFAYEVALEHPTAVTLATPSHRLGLRLQHLLATPSFRLFVLQDVVGVELGGALKNVIALAAGVVDGLGWGSNTKAILMARGLSEMAALGVAMGAKAHTFYGLSGVGDLFLTCSGAQSRNRKVGEAIGKGMSLDQILHDMKMVAEGVHTVKAVYALSREYQVPMPIVSEVYRVLFKQKSPRDAVSGLMAQAYGKEFFFHAGS